VIIGKDFQKLSRVSNGFQTRFFEKAIRNTKVDLKSIVRLKPHLLHDFHLSSQV